MRKSLKTEKKLYQSTDQVKTYCPNPDLERTFSKEISELHLVLNLSVVFYI